MLKLNQIKDVSLNKEDTIKKAMQLLDKSKFGFFIVKDKKNRLLGTVTDGDIRRAILKGININASITECMNKKPKILSTKDINKFDAILLKLKAYNKFIPVVDEKNNIQYIFLEQKKQISRTALLMAGGFGKRLGRKTKNTPKPLIKIGEDTILEQILKKLEKFKYDNVYISTHYLHKKIENFIKNRKSLLNIHVIYEKEPLGTAGSINYLKELNFNYLTVINADIIFDVNLSSLNNFHLEKKCDMTLTVAKFKYQLPYGVIGFDKNFCLKTLKEKPYKEEFVLSGIYCINKKICDLVDEKYTDMTDLINTAGKLGKKISIFPIYEYWNDIGEPNTLKKEILRNKKIK